ncbi:MAG: hypothetical protein QOD06_1175, partial [Candidatus Binatota bacterium]|nr:hypothetical protein [Candidatus Binatota bacterium]
LFVAIGAATAELAPPERLSQALGLTGASMLVMNAIAPAVAEPLADAAGWPAVFVLAAAAALVSALLARRVREPASRHARDRNLRSGLFQVLARPLVAHYACVVLLAGMTFGTVVTFEPPFALAHGREQVRGFYVAFAGSAILVRIFLGHAPDRFGRHLVAGLSLALYAASASGLALAPSSLLEVIGAIFGIAHGLFYPALNAIALASVSAHERGRVMAIFTAAFNLGVGATVFLGVAAEHVGYAPVFHVAGAAALAAAIVVATSRELRVAGAREPRSTSR